MSKYFYGLFLVLTCFLAWSQTDTSTLLLPPPSNPVPVGDMGAHRFFVLNNNVTPSQPLELSTNGVNFSKSQEVKSAMPSPDQNIQSKSRRLSKSLEGNVNGLQFVKPGPLYSE